MCMTWCRPLMICSYLLADIKPELNEMIEVEIVVNKLNG